MKLKTTTKLMLVAWVPPLQFIVSFLLARILNKNNAPEWPIISTLFVISFAGAWTAFKALKKTTLFKRPGSRSAAIILSVLYTMELPLFGILGAIISSNNLIPDSVISLEVFQNVLFGIIAGIIPASFLLFVLNVIRKEADIDEEPYKPVLKFILASFSMLWLVNLGLHYCFDLPYLLHSIFHDVPIEKWRFVFSKYAERSIASYFTIRAFPFFVYVVLNGLFFGRLLFFGKFKDRQARFFSSTGMLMVTGLFLFHHLLVNVGPSIFRYKSKMADRYLHTFLVSMSSITGPVLLMAMILVLIGGILSCTGKSFKQIRLSGSSRAIGITLSLAAAILYIVLFKGLWPFQDPSSDIIFGISKNHRTSYMIYDHTVGGAYHYEFFLYGKRNVKMLIKKLAAPDPGTRYIGAFYLIFFGDQRATVPLIEMLKDSKESPHYAAAVALGHIKDPRAVEPLIKALEESESCSTYVIALGLLADPRAIEPLLNRLDAKCRWDRKDVVEALSVFKSPIIVEKLIQRLEKEVGEDNIMWAINGALKKISGIDEYPKDLYEKDSDGPQWAAWWRQWLKENNRPKSKGRLQ